MTIDTKTIVTLRKQTGAGLADCKKALELADGNIDKALEELRKSGATKAAKKSAERTTKAGLVGSYIHGEGRIGALVKVACETDFVAKNDDFKELVNEIAMQVAAMAPLYVSKESVPEDVIVKEKDIYIEQLKTEGKPENIWDKIVDGKLEKFYEDIVLLNQVYMKDDSKKISDLINEAIAKTGEKIEVIEISRFEV